MGFNAPKTRTLQVLDVLTAVTPDYRSLKEVALFLVSPAALPDIGLALRLYISIGGQEWQFRGYVSIDHPSEVQLLVQNLPGTYWYPCIDWVGQRSHHQLGPCKSRVLDTLWAERIPDFQVMPLSWPQNVAVTGPTTVQVGIAIEPLGKLFLLLRIPFPADQCLLGFYCRRLV